MKILISSCVFGNRVRWNGTNRRSEEINEWAETMAYELVPVCPENELFGTQESQSGSVKKMTKFWQLWATKKFILNYKINVKK